MQDADVGVTWNLRAFDLACGWAVQYNATWRPQVNATAVRRHWRPGRGWRYQPGEWHSRGPPPYWLQVELRERVRQWLTSPRACRSRYRHQQIRPRIVRRKAKPWGGTSHGRRGNKFRER